MAYCLVGIGGALVSPETHQTEQKKLIGSAGVYEAASLEEVRKVIEEDIYWTAGVVCVSIYEKSNGLILEAVGQREDCNPALVTCYASPSHRPRLIISKCSGNT